MWVVIHANWARVGRLWPCWGTWLDFWNDLGRLDKCSGKPGCCWSTSARSEPVDAAMQGGEQPVREQLREEESGGYSEPQPEHDSPGSIIAVWAGTNRSIACLSPLKAHSEDKGIRTTAAETLKPQHEIQVRCQNHDAPEETAWEISEFTLLQICKTKLKRILLKLSVYWQWWYLRCSPGIEM